MVFPFKEKGFPHKSLCSYMVVLLLCMLKIYSQLYRIFPNFSQHNYQQEDRRRITRVNGL